MTKKENSSLSDLENRVDLLVKRFEEQKGIIDSYIVRERDWKKNKIIQNKEITKLIKVIVICAYDISGAVNIIENLEQNELEDKLLIISGPVTNNVSAFNQSISKFKFKNLDFLNIYNSANHVNVFAKMINRISDD